MKILYAVQGTGNGHVSRAREIIPFLQEFAEVDVLLSGTQAEVELPVEPKFRFSGMGFVFGKHGGVDFLQTWKDFHFIRFFKDVLALPVKDYDLVIHDFEPVTAWACKLRRKKCLTLSHQSSYNSPKVPQLKGFHWGIIIMDHYAPATKFVGFHFDKYDKQIYTPVIRREIRELNPSDGGYYTVYLPAYSDSFILDLARKFPEERWQIFSKKTSEAYTQGNAEFLPVENSAFIKSLENCTGLLTGGGFEGPAEALFLGKKLLAVPMKNQYEQQCNALALENMGVPVVWHESEFPVKISQWLKAEKAVAVHFPDETRDILEKYVKNNYFQL